jgi:hypothetical protein
MVVILHPRISGGAWLAHGLPLLAIAVVGVVEDITRGARGPDAVMSLLLAWSAVTVMGGVLLLKSRA